MSQSSTKIELQCSPIDQTVLFEYYELLHRLLKAMEHIRVEWDREQIFEWSTIEGERTD